MAVPNIWVKKQYQFGRDSFSAVSQAANLFNSFSAVSQAISLHTLKTTLIVFSSKAQS